MNEPDFAGALQPVLRDAAEILSRVLVERFPGVRVVAQHQATETFAILAFVSVQIRGDEDFESVDAGMHIARHDGEFSAQWSIAREDGEWVDEGGDVRRFTAGEWNDGLAEAVATGFAAMVRESLPGIVDILDTYYQGRALA